MVDPNQRENAIFRGIHKTKKLSKLRSGHAKEEDPVGTTDADKEAKLQIQQLNSILIHTRNDSVCL